jgi:hypothetical protein
VDSGQSLVAITLPGRLAGKQNRREREVALQVTRNLLIVVSTLHLIGGLSLCYVK